MPRHGDALFGRAAEIGARFYVRANRPSPPYGMKVRLSATGLAPATEQGNGEPRKEADKALNG